MKTCYKCEEEKPDSEFSRNDSKADGLQSQCKSCHREYRRQHYLRNRQKYIDKAARHRERLREWFHEFKTQLKCEQCKESHPACLQFHHSSPEDKEIAVSCAVHRWSRKRLLHEIEKCTILCANCHAKLHYEERLSSRD